MAKKKPIVHLHSYGVFTQWDATAKELPKITQFTLDIPADIDIEFGFTVNIKKAKGAKLRYCIYHPSITDQDGDVLAPFDGYVYVRTNDWDFYLGDTIWAPIENKIGPWRMTLEMDGDIIAEKTFNVFRHDEEQFWKQRGC